MPRPDNIVVIKDDHGYADLDCLDIMQDVKTPNIPTPFPMNRCITLLCSALFIPSGHLAAAEIPQSVTELWAGFDPRKDPLDIEVLKEWEQEKLDRK